MVVHGRVYSSELIRLDILKIPHHKRITPRFNRNQNIFATTDVLMRQHSMVVNDCQSNTGHSGTRNRRAGNGVSMPLRRDGGLTTRDDRFRTEA